MTKLQLFFFSGSQGWVAEAAEWAARDDAEARGVQESGGWGEGQAWKWDHEQEIRGRDTLLLKRILIKWYD